MAGSRGPLRVIAGATVALAGLACSVAAQREVPVVGSEATPAVSAPFGSGAGLASTSTAQSVFGFLPAPTGTALLGAPVAMPAIPESRRLTLEYPAAIRAGDSDVIRLTLEVDDLAGITPTPEIPGNVITGGFVQFPNVYQTHSVLAEADLDLAGVEFQPTGPVSETLLPGESVTFRWSVHPTSPGVYRGTAWLFLIFTDRATGDQSRKAISAQPIQIEATTLFGLGGEAARIAGGLGAVGGGVLGFPFADDLLKWLWSRVRRRA